MYNLNEPTEDGWADYGAMLYRRSDGPSGKGQHALFLATKFGLTVYTSGTEANRLNIFGSFQSYTIGKVPDKTVKDNGQNVIPKSFFK